MKKSESEIPCKSKIKEESKKEEGIKMKKSKTYKEK